ncbi:hypothetical protein [Thalassoroseus pseudoceratinae]|uniref:hypothetical protein n=1 Tax=Thalassoroseus pseudoceratinae TaxID=2713176 RepID=UPI00141F8C79|nr:hypothetical protein [Thalassoroseus pseudoceratinae]
MNEDRQPKFFLGQTLATPGALESIQEANQSPMEFLQQHVAGKWGEVDEEDASENENVLLHGERILSVYRTTQDVKLRVITEADRSATTILLPEEY